MRQNSRGTEAGRAWWWAVLRTERDRRLAAAGEWPITTPNLRRLLSRRLARVGEDRPLCETPGLRISSVLAAGKETEMSDMDFPQRFKDLTGNAPLSWQTRLYDEHFAKGDLRSVIDLPTGLGKTMVMAIWLIARAEWERERQKKEPNDKLDVPTRLIYVVDRRTVVDQATDLATKLRDNCKQALGIDPPVISTLRGQLADNREWSRDPSKPAIIIGTVDLIGSALLFSGYRSGYKYKPHEAGLLGMDSLLVLDEAHLSKPFDKLLDGIAAFNKGVDHGSDFLRVKPLEVIRMSATTGNVDKDKTFTLELDQAGKLNGKDADDKTIGERFSATKTLSIKTGIDPKKLTQTIADCAIELANSGKLVGKRIVVFVRRPKDAREIAEKIREHQKPTKSKSNPDPKGPYTDFVEVLTGTMRGLERDKLVDTYVLKRFLDGDENPTILPNQRPVFLISTSAGEVGMDLNADHMVCDATTIDSFIQRLGRVNRRGYGSAEIRLIVEAEKTDKDGKPKKLEGVDRAIANSVKLLEGVKDVSPQGLKKWKDSLWTDFPAQTLELDVLAVDERAWVEHCRQQCASKIFDPACSPDPKTVELTDILLDNWSMTTITERMPGRPDVAPWLRGLDDQQSQTMVAWRAEIDLVNDHPDPEKALEAIFHKHPIRPHESLTVNTRYLVDDFLKELPSDLLQTTVAVRFPRGQIERQTLQQLTQNSGSLYAETTLILPARFGGLDAAGMLDVASVPKAPAPDEPAPKSLDEADHPGYEPTESELHRIRLILKRDDAGWFIHPLDGGAPLPESLHIEERFDVTTPLFAKFRQAGYRVRLRQPIELDDEDTAIRSLVMLAPLTKRGAKADQSLDDHVARAVYHAGQIIKALALKPDDPLRLALEFAADWHDEGKKARIWQIFANNPKLGAVPLGKMVQARDPKSLKRYRHEFGSILRIHHQDQFDKIDCTLPKNLDAQNLSLHLIATHHGGGRPHFPMARYDPLPDELRDARHVESIQRFARLQRKYGWWGLAWLENLLRCADQLASAEVDSETDEDEPEGEEQ